MAPLSFGAPPRRRRPSLTPMIDVVFLLLVFFMLAARFGPEQAITLAGAGGGGGYEGPPRLVEVLPAGLRLNGVAHADDALLRELGRLTRSPSDLVVLRARDGVETQALVRAAELLAGAGFERLALVE
jgi:biopolymer transport protein ExbD